MRLINADKLINRATDINGSCWDMTSQSTEDFVDFVNDQPTACDIDAIKSEIQFYADNHAEPFEMGAYYHCLKIIDDYTYVYGEKNESTN